MREAYQCGEYSQIGNEHGDYELPEGLRQSILRTVRDDLNTLIVENQLRTYIASILVFDGPQYFKSHFIQSVSDSLLSVWSNIDSVEGLSVSFGDEEFMDEVLYYAVGSYVENGGVIGVNTIAEIQGEEYFLGDYVSADYWSNYFSEFPIDNSNADYLGELQIAYANGYISYEEYVGFERIKRINHFEILRNSGFSPPLQAFIRDELFPRLLPGIEFTRESMDRLRHFCLFLIDIETSRGTDLENGVSTATSYTQTLNQAHASRSRGEYNSIDTRLRLAARFYNTDLGKYAQVEPRNIEDPEGEWVYNMWEYNEAGRDMIEFSFNDEIRLLLLFFFDQEPQALQDILLGNNIRRAAQTLYAAHHTNAYAHIATNTRMSLILETYYG